MALLVVGGALALLPGGSATGKAKNTVEVGDDYFLPIKLEVKQGATVKFDWTGVGEHNVSKGTRGPGGYFDSGPLQGDGVLYSRKFKKAGTYDLICTLHEGMEMVLKVKKKRKRN